MKINHNELIDLERIQKIVPYWYYFDYVFFPTLLTLSNFIKVPDGFNLFVRKFNYVRSDFVLNDFQIVGIPDFRISIIDKYRGRPMQKSPYNPNLMSSPGIEYPVVAPGVNAPWPLYGTVELNYFFNHSETIEIRVDKADSAVGDAEFKILFASYLIPIKKGYFQWKK